MSKKNSNRIGVVYSTNPDFEYEEIEELEAETLPNNQQRLYVQLDKKQRAGKQVTLITGFIGRSEDLEKLGKELKSTAVRIRLIFLLSATAVRLLQPT